MGRPSKIWQRGQDGQYYTTHKGVQHKLGHDLGVAKLKFAQITGNEVDEREPVIRAVLDAAMLVSRYLTRKEAVALLDAIYAMKLCTDEASETE